MILWYHAIAVRGEQPYAQRYNGTETKSVSHRRLALFCYPDMADTREVKNSYGLTLEQERYCMERVKNKSPREAYKAATTDTDVSSQAAALRGNRLEKLEAVQRRLTELQALVNAKAIASAQQIQADLFLIASDESVPTGTRLKAYDQLARMLGAYKDGLTVSGQSVLTIADKREALRALLRPPVDVVAESEATVTDITPAASENPPIEPWPDLPPQSTPVPTEENPDADGTPTPYDLDDVVPIESEPLGAYEDDIDLVPGASDLLGADD